MKNEAIVWNDFHDYWNLLANKLNIPIYFVRYEDLLENNQV